MLSLNVGSIFFLLYDAYNITLHDIVVERNVRASFITSSFSIPCCHPRSSFTTAAPNQPTFKLYAGYVQYRCRFTNNLRSTVPDW